jgi:hypothetical protein
VEGSVVAHLLRQFRYLPFQPLDLPLLLLQAVGELRRWQWVAKGRWKGESW